MRPLTIAMTRAAAQGTPGLPAKSAATARARRARRNLPQPVKSPESRPQIATPTPTMPTTAFVVSETEKDEFDDPDFFAVDPEVIKLEGGSAAAAAKAAAAASGAVVVISSSNQKTTNGAAGKASAAAAAAAAAGAAGRAAELDAALAALKPADVDSRTDLLIALATAGARFELVLAEGIERGLVDDLTLRLLERRLSAARASVGGGGDDGTGGGGTNSAAATTTPPPPPDAELVATVRGLAVLWSRLRSEVERQEAPPAERAIDDALRELAAGGPGPAGRERAEEALRRATGLSGSAAGFRAGGGGGIDILAVAAASELAQEEEDEEDEEEAASSSASAPFRPQIVVPAAVVSATCSQLLAAARRQVGEVERALRAAKEQQTRGSSASSSPSFGRAERLLADRRELVAALQEVLDIVNGL